MSQVGYSSYTLGTCPLSQGLQSGTTRIFIGGRVALGGQAPLDSHDTVDGNQKSGNHHLGCIKPCKKLKKKLPTSTGFPIKPYKWWDKLPTSTGLVCPSPRISEPNPSNPLWPTHPTAKSSHDRPTQWNNFNRHRVSRVPWAVLKLKTVDHFDPQGESPAGETSRARLRNGRWLGPQKKMLENTWV